MITLGTLLELVLIHSPATETEGFTHKKKLWKLIVMEKVVMQKGDFDWLNLEFIS